MTTSSTSTPSKSFDLENWKPEPSDSVPWSRAPEHLLVNGIETLTGINIEDEALNVGDESEKARVCFIQCTEEAVESIHADELRDLVALVVFDKQARNYKTYDVQQIEFARVPVN